MRILFCCLLFTVGGSGLLIGGQTKNPPHIHQEDQNELDKLNYFIGSWVLRAKVKQNPASEEARFSRHRQSNG
jgi:hypothetical protein